MSENNTINMNIVFQNVCKNGSYYNPAWSHYGRMTNVKCDKCGNTNLRVCIGWKKYDMCLECVDLMVDLMARDALPDHQHDTDYPDYPVEPLPRTFRPVTASYLPRTEDDDIYSRHPYINTNIMQPHQPPPPKPSTIPYVNASF